MEILLIFEALLFAYWILAAGAVIVTILPLPVPRAFKVAVELSAARGKLCDASFSSLPSWLQELKVPQFWFLHFYIIGAVSNVAVLLVYSNWCCWASELSSPNPPQNEWWGLLALTLFQIHLVRRTLETAFLMKYPRDAKMHLIAYIFGLSYYVVVPLSLVPHHTYHEFDLTTFTSASFRVHTAAEKLHTGLRVWPKLGWTLTMLGTVVFCMGNVLQFWAHCQLRMLQLRAQQRERSAEGKKAGATLYLIPAGGMFELISCPHYFAEIVVYTGVALITRGAPLPMLILLWVVVNLILGATATHAWYRKHFKEYPRRRKALVPFVY